MDVLLQEDSLRRGEIMRHTLFLAETFFESQADRPPGVIVPELPKEELPEAGMGAVATLSFFEKEYAHLLNNSAGPRYFGFVTGGSTPASIAGDWLASAFDQNACGSNDSIAPQIEHQTIGYLKQLFRLSEDYFGSFVTGATMSNMVGLALGRQWVGEQHGIDVSDEGLGGFRLRILSGTPHSTIVKSLAMLGIGRDALVKVDTITDREAVDIASLEQVLSESDEPVVVVANSGTVNSGDFDDLEAIGRLKKKYRFWLHVDGAFGGFAACSEKLRHLTEGINYADSITIDAHKWLNVPYDSAMQFTRHKALQLKVFRNSASYLGDPAQSPDFFHYTPETSRRWRALPAWFTLRSYGKRGYSEIIERNCALARLLGDKIERSERFVLLSPVKLNIVCFTLKEPSLSFELIQGFLRAVTKQGEAFFTPTVFKGTPAIRAAVSNWQTQSEDIAKAFEALCRIETTVSH